MKAALVSQAPKEKLKAAGIILCGLDLGQLQDYTALTILRVRIAERPVTIEDDPHQRYESFDRFGVYDLIHAERFQSVYSDAIDRCLYAVGHPDLFLDEKELVDYFGMQPQIPEPSIESSIRAMAENAAPETVFLLDSRIPLPGIADSTDLERHLFKLRSVDAGSLNAVEAEASSPFAD